MRVFLDANILFSAAKSDGAVRGLIEKLFASGHECWVDAYVVEEARRNLAAKAIAEATETLGRLLGRMHMASGHHGHVGLEATLPVNEKDQPVLAAAIRHQCAALLTGDRTHFGPLFGKSVRGVTVYSPRMLAEAVLAPR